MKYIALFLYLVFHAGFVNSAEHCVQNYNTIGLVGLDNPNGSLFASVSGHNNGCGCNYVRFYSKNTDTDKALSILTAAKLANKKVRIDLSDKNNCNSAYRVYLH
ncbi:hypothetical protein AAOGI_41480 [Agarivorans albus]